MKVLHNIYRRYISSNLITLIIAVTVIMVIVPVMNAEASEDDMKTSYHITQYADITDGQAMFYTIESTKGELIVIDGGWVGNADYVRFVIGEKGNKVDAWILTHPHPDHIGAFNEIMKIRME